MSINVIYDEEKAIREKQEKDAISKKLRLPVRIVGCLTLAAVAVAIVVVYLSVVNILSSVWMGFAITIAVFFAVGFWFVWNSASERQPYYSANAKYYTASNGKTIKDHSIRSF